MIRSTLRMKRINGFSYAVRENPLLCDPLLYSPARARNKL